MVCIGKNIANYCKNPQFLPVMCVLCARCAARCADTPPKALHCTLYHAEHLGFRNFSHGCWSISNVQAAVLCLPRYDCHLLKLVSQVVLKNTVTVHQTLRLCGQRRRVVYCDSTPWVAWVQP